MKQRRPPLAAFGKLMRAGAAAYAPAGLAIVFRDGFDARVAWREGVDAVELPTSAWRLARQRYPEAGPVATCIDSNDR
jgi:hypothetical protein